MPSWQLRWPRPLFESAFMQTIRDLFRGGKGWFWVGLLALAAFVVVQLGAAEHRNLTNPEKPRAEKQSASESGKPFPVDPKGRQLDNTRPNPTRPVDEPNKNDSE